MLFLGGETSHLILFASSRCISSFIFSADNEQMTDFQPCIPVISAWQGGVCVLLQVLAGFS